MPLKRLLIVIPLLASLWIQAQKNNDVFDYINTYKELAMQEMVRSGVPASIKLAQGIHETLAGKSDLVIKSNNHFGIKCKATWAGNKVYHDDDARGECFRSYSSPSDSYMDHSNFLKGSQRYAFLFNLDPTDYKGWAYGLKQAGYATNIKYSQIIIKLIEDYNLQQYSLIALGKLSPKDEVIVGGGTPIRTVEDGALAGPVIVGTTPPVAEPVVAEVPKVTYPEGQFTINNTKVVYAKAGSSLLALAQQYDVSLKRLVDFNDLDEEDVLTEGQLLYLQRKRKVGANEKHTVLEGENLYDICQAEGIRYESLLEYNHLVDDDVPAPGEALYLQRKAPGRPKLVTEVAQVAQPVQVSPVAPQPGDMASVNYTMHTVQTKETLYSIAKKYSITVEQLKAWNKIDGYDLKVGQALIIYKN
jgi:LysM repeat protein